MDNNSTDFGIDIEVRLEHPLKIPSPILETDVPIMTSLSRLHSENVLEPILVTLFGITIDVRL